MLRYELNGTGSEYDPIEGFSEHVNGPPGCTTAVNFLTI
jgi:hypothetical protein